MEEEAPYGEDVGIEEDVYDEYETESVDAGDARIARFYRDKKRISDDEWKERIGVSFEEVYIIQTGDTLWDISTKFLDSPWYWPKIWELNSYITNPHLIYPGNELKFSFNIEDGPSIKLVQGTVEEELKEEKERDYSVLERELPAPAFDNLGFHKASLQKTSYRSKASPGFGGGKIMLGESPDYSGEIYAATTIRNTLLTADNIEIKTSDNSDCARGTRYVAVENSSGPIYNIAGEIVVTGGTTEKRKCRARITRAYSGMYRGIKLAPPMVQESALVRTESQQITGSIYSLDPEEKKMAAEGDKLFLRFSGSGSPMPGTLVYIYEIRDPNTDSRMDPFIIGVAKLLHSSGRYGTATVIASSRVISTRSTVTTRF
ncbi:MAG: LysM peptidoglycan-binding domain-containing protein [Oligoflexia bacterium]|nr:LysM peptidoglycan-binding domain-containing protein [Oligoflexia bacterium]